MKGKGKIAKGAPVPGGGGLHLRNHPKTMVMMMRWVIGNGNYDGKEVSRILWVRGYYIYVKLRKPLEWVVWSSYCLGGKGSPPLCPVHLLLQIFRLVARQSNRTWNVIGPKRLLIALKIENNILKIRFF